MATKPSTDNVIKGGNDALLDDQASVIEFFNNYSMSSLQPSQIVIVSMPDRAWQ